MAGKNAQGFVEVTFEDQQNINKFSRLNTRMHELAAQVKAKKKILEDLEDAGNELMLSDEDSVRFVIGECFVHVEKDHAEERLQDLTDECSKDVEVANEEISNIKDQMKELKTVLYAKFKDSINLEE
mmetsp:Transcript_12604/g.27240  ORF Transcript_12604/g.27240 Transcript_12604/m.27240 type:complete len:127 (-) Transcript_12604:499-879(-)